LAIGGFVPADLHVVRHGSDPVGPGRSVAPASRRSLRFRQVRPDLEQAGAASWEHVASAMTPGSTH
jgi:hypothetical protein